MKILYHFSWMDGTIEKFVEYDNKLERVLRGGSNYCIEKVTATETTKKEYEDYQKAMYIFNVDLLRSEREKVAKQLLFSNIVPTICSDPIFKDICTLFKVLYLGSFEEGMGMFDAVIIYHGTPYWISDKIKQSDIPQRFHHIIDVSKNNFYLLRKSNLDGIKIEIQDTDTDKMHLIYQCSNSKEFDQGEAYYCGRMIKQLHY